MNNNDLGKKLYNKKIVNNISKKINKLGISSNINVYTYLNIKFISSIILFFVILYISSIGYVLAPVITIIYFMMYDKMFLDSKIKKRTTILEEEAIYFFEVLVLSLETGKNLEAALNITTNNIDNELSKEFKKALKEMKYGKSRVECLNDMQKYIPCDSINNIILTLVQASNYGSSIIKTLNNQIDYIREKRKLELKAEISKLPIKISIISVLFFVPLVLLIILGPVLLNYIG